MRPTRYVLAAALVAGGTLIAQAATNETVKARQDLMKEIAASVKVMGDMAQGTTGFDAAAAAAARDRLIGAAGEIAARFEAEESDPESEAKPEIWLAFDDFGDKAGALAAAAEAADVGTLDTLRAAMGEVAGSCRACHQLYRM